MSNMIRTIARNSVILSEKFSPQFKKAAQMSALAKAGREGMRYAPDGLIYPQQGQEFNTSPNKPVKEYQKKQGIKKVGSHYPERLKTKGRNFVRFTDGRMHEVLITGEHRKLKTGTKLQGAVNDN